MAEPTPERRRELLRELQDEAIDAGTYGEPAPERTPREVRIAFVEPDPPPTFLHTDVDGDRLFAATAEIPGQGAGIYFRTDPKGSSIPVGRLDELIEQLRVIANAAREAVDG